MPYYCCGNFLYSDVSSSKTLFENNILYGSGSEALYHHCGLENESKNNIVHRETRPANGEKPLGNLWAGCEKNTGKFQSFSNHHNIYYFEDTRDFSLYKQYDLRFRTSLKECFLPTVSPSLTFLRPAVTGMFGRTRSLLM